MTTSLGTYLGTRLGTELGTGSDESSELQTLELYLAKNLFSWMRADYRTEAGGKVTAFQDKVLLPSQGGLAGNARSIDANHAFAQATGALQVPAISTDAAWNGREVADFSAGGLIYKSTIAASNWKFCHDGTSMEVHASYSPANTTGNQMIVSSRSSSGGVGFCIYRSAGATTVNGYFEGNSVTVIASGAIGTIANSSPSYASVRLRKTASPEWSGAIKTTIGASGAAGTPSTADPAGGFSIGGDGSVNSSRGKITDVLIANQDSAVLRVNVRRYLALRYPVLA